MKFERSLRAVAVAALTASALASQAQTFSNNTSPVYNSNGWPASVDAMMAGRAAFQTFALYQSRVLDSWGFEVAGGDSGAVRLSIRQVVGDPAAPVGFYLGQEVASFYDTYGIDDQAVSFNNLNLALGPGGYAAVLTPELGPDVSSSLPVTSTPHVLSLLMATNDGGLSDRASFSQAYTYSGSLLTPQQGMYTILDGNSLMFSASFLTPPDHGSGTGSGVVAAVPEPSTYALMGACLATVALLTRRRQAQSNA